MTNVAEIAVGVFTVLSAAVATFRAGSRGLYLLRNDGRIGVVDGPLILGPDEVAAELAALRRRHAVAEKQRRDSGTLIAVEADREVNIEKCGGVDKEAGEETSAGGRKKDEEEDLVSPLWEPTFGFRRAVELALDDCVGPEWDDSREKTRPDGLPSTIISTSAVSGHESGDERMRRASVTVARISPLDAGRASGAISPAWEAVSGLFTAVEASNPREDGVTRYSLSPYATYKPKSPLVEEGKGESANGGVVEVSDGDTQPMAPDGATLVTPSALTVIRRGSAEENVVPTPESAETPPPSSIATSKAVAAVFAVGTTVVSPALGLASAAASAARSAILSRSGTRKDGGAGDGRAPGAWEIRIDEGAFEGEDLDCNIVASTVIDIPMYVEHGIGLAAAAKGSGAAGAELNVMDLPRRRCRRRIARISAYAPETFASLRARFGISEQSFRHSMIGMGPYVSFESNSKGAARVGGYFFFTPDGAYMVKTVKREEARTFLKMLPKYYYFMKRNSRRSLLTRFCGMYGVRVEDATEASLGTGSGGGGGEEHVLLVMNAVFPPEGSQFIHERFDLKGSTVGRECSAEERMMRGRQAVLKDLDLAREVEAVRTSTQGKRRRISYGINVGARAKSALLSQLRRDVALLAECSVMDYSLLVGVVHADGQESPLLSPTIPSQKSDSVVALAEHEKMALRLLHALMLPLRTLTAPPTYLVCSLFVAIELTVSTFLTRPFPYYGAGMCGVDGGALSVLQGKRHGGRAVYYMGVIDFLQPWTVRKVLERQMKGAIGYDTQAISCVDPKAYAERFLEFIDAHVT